MVGLALGSSCGGCFGKGRCRCGFGLGLLSVMLRPPLGIEP